MKYEPRKPVNLAERREAQKATVAEIIHAGRADVSAPAGEKCPECGSAEYHHVEGCKVCFSCGYSPCGVH
jgi:hypothetical protein